MRVKLIVFQESESVECPWDEIEKVLLRWTAAHASFSTDFCFPRQSTREIILDLQANDQLLAIRQLHDELYDLRVNFILTVP